jgi:hypothetical protein
MLTEAEDPPLRRVRSKSKVNILYCYGDASGSGFGGALISVRGSDTSWENGVRVFRKQHPTTAS